MLQVFQDFCGSLVSGCFVGWWACQQSDAQELLARAAIPILAVAQAELMLFSCMAGYSKAAILWFARGEVLVVYW